MKIIITLLTITLLTGCSLFEKRVEFREKVVPVYMVPEPPELERPVLPIHSERYNNPVFLSNPNNLGQIVQDFTVSLRLAMNYSLAQEEIINTYRELSDRDFSLEPVQLLSARIDGNNNIPMSRSDFGSLEIYADQRFSEIIDKYEDNKQEILNNETE